MCFMLVLICALFTVLGFVLMSVVSSLLVYVSCFLRLGIVCCDVVYWMCECYYCMGCLSVRCVYAK